jgi:hypothetical protein
MPTQTQTSIVGTDLYAHTFGPSPSAAAAFWVIAAFIVVIMVISGLNKHLPPPKL